MPDSLHPITHISYMPDQVAARAAAVYEAVLGGSPNIRTGNFRRIGSDDLEFLFAQYDRHFFDGRLQTLVERADVASLHFRPSRRMTRRAGQTKRTTETVRSGGSVRKRHRYEIAVAADMLFHAFDDPHRAISVSGFACTDRLQALQRIFEHELVHLIELVLWDKSSCARIRFQALAGQIFGHTEFTHQIITHAERAGAKHGIRIGDRVAFRHDGVRHVGFVNRITKRATVLVEDAQGDPYSDGKRYLTFYVPVQMLERVDGR